MKAEHFRALLISWAIPPAATGSAIIISNLVRQFSREEIVVLGSKFAGSPPVQWKGHWPKLIYATLEPAGNWPKRHWIRWAQWPLLLLRAMWVAVCGKFDVILTVYPDASYLLAGYLVSMLANKPLLLYLHNMYLECEPTSLAKWLQPRAFARAKHIFVMSGGMHRLYRTRYPNLTCTPLIHSFTEPLPDPAHLPELSMIKTPLHLVLSGNIGASNLDATKRIVQAIEDLPDVRLTLYTSTAGRALRAYGLTSSKVQVATVSRDKLVELLGEADILILPHGFTGHIADEIQTIFPTRVIEYLISGRPILAHLPNDCFLAEFLEQHNCALLVTEPDVKAIQQAIVQLKNDVSLRRELVANAFQAARQFHAPIVADHLRMMLRTLEDS